MNVQHCRDVTSPIMIGSDPHLTEYSHKWFYKMDPYRPDPLFP